MKSTAALPAFAGVILTLIASLPNTGCSPRPPRHGTSFLVLVETNQATAPSEHEQALAEIRDVLQRRLEQTGVGRPFFQPTNEGQLRILLPPLREPAIASIRKLIERPGILEFRMVHP